MKRYADNPMVRNYLGTVVEQIKFTEARESVRRELLGHLEDNITAAKNAKDDEESAVAFALEKMGDPTETGRALDTIHRPKVDFVLIAIVLLLNMCGLYALSSTEWIGRQLIWMTLGAVIAFLIFQLNCLRLQFALRAAYIIAALGLIAAQFFGILYKGQPYLSIFGIGIKIVDVASCLMAISLPAISELLTSIRQKSIVIAVLTLTPVFYFASTASIVPATLLLVAGVITLSKCDVRKIAPLGTGMFGLAIIAAFAKQGFTLTDGIVVFSDYTDFVLSSFRQNSQLGATMAIGLLLMLVCYFGFSLMAINTIWLRTTALICSCLFGLEITLGIAANFNVVPMFRLGINIPFLSYGGSLLVVHFLMIGVMSNCLYRKSVQYV